MRLPSTFSASPWTHSRRSGHGTGEAVTPCPSRRSRPAARRHARSALPAAASAATCPHAAVPDCRAPEPPPNRSERVPPPTARAARGLRRHPLRRADPPGAARPQGTRRAAAGPPLGQALALAVRAAPPRAGRQPARPLLLVPMPSARTTRARGHNPTLRSPSPRRPRCVPGDVPTRVLPALRHARGGRPVRSRRADRRRNLHGALTVPGTHRTTSRGPRPGVTTSSLPAPPWPEAARALTEAGADVLAAAVVGRHAPATEPGRTRNRAAPGPGQRARQKRGQPGKRGIGRSWPPCTGGCRTDRNPAPLRRRSSRDRLGGCSATVAEFGPGRPWCRLPVDRREDPASVEGDPSISTDIAVAVWSPREAQHHQAVAVGPRHRRDRADRLGDRPQSVDRELRRRSVPIRWTRPSPP